MVWAIIVDIAYLLVCSGCPRRAGLFVLCWRLGLRPSEAVNLRGGDLYSSRRDRRGGQPAFVRLGVGRGTKANRRQVARVHPWDLVADHVVTLFAASTPTGARLSDIGSYTALANVLALALKTLGYATLYTPHCLRSGWATWRFLGGQPIMDLMADGRWHSETSLRVYLDAVAAADTLQDPYLATRFHWTQQLDASILSWLRW